MDLHSCKDTLVFKVSIDSGEKSLFNEVDISVNVYSTRGC